MQLSITVKNISSPNTKFNFVSSKESVNKAENRDENYKNRCLPSYNLQSTFRMYNCHFGIETS